MTIVDINTFLQNETRVFVHDVCMVNHTCNEGTVHHVFLAIIITRNFN